MLSTAPLIERDEVSWSVATSLRAIIHCNFLFVKTSALQRSSPWVRTSGYLSFRKRLPSGSLKKRAESTRAISGRQLRISSTPVETVEGRLLRFVKGGLILDVASVASLPPSLGDLRRVRMKLRIHGHSY